MSIGRIISMTTSRTPGISVCRHCSIMSFFVTWTSSSQLPLNSWWPRVGGVGVGCPSPHCSSHLTLNSWWLRVGGVGVVCPPPHCSPHFTLNSWWPRKGVGCPAPHCSSHLTLNSWWPRVDWVSSSSLLISLNSQLLMTKGGGWVSCSSLLISLNSQLMMTKGGGGEVSYASLLISQIKLIAVQQWSKTDFHCCMPAQFKLVLA